MKKETVFSISDAPCAGPPICPLSRVQTGATVHVKRLSMSPSVSERLREMGLCEDRAIKILARQSNYICQVCNSRLAISPKLAESIMVQAALTAPGKPSVRLAATVTPAKTPTAPGAS